MRFADSQRRPFDAQRITRLVSDWPRDAASSLRDVSLELGLDVSVGQSPEEQAAADAAATAAAIEANPGAPSLRFSVGDRVEHKYAVE